MQFASIVGKSIDSVGVSGNREQFTIVFEDGTSKSYGVEGDCCSSSWIEHLEVPSSIKGAKILTVEDGEGVPWDGHACGTCEHDSLSVYNTKFRTDKGTIVLEYRNDSNGYYGGYLVEFD